MIYAAIDDYYVMLQLSFTSIIPRILIQSFNILFQLFRAGDIIKQIFCLTVGLSGKKVT